MCPQINQIASRLSPLIENKSPYKKSNHCWPIAIPQGSTPGSFISLGVYAEIVWHMEYLKDFHCGPMLSMKLCLVCVTLCVVNLEGWYKRDLQELVSFSIMYIYIHSVGQGVSQ